MSRQYPSPKHAEYMYKKLRAALPETWNANDKDALDVMKSCIRKAFNCSIQHKKMANDLGEFVSGTRTIYLRDTISHAEMSILLHELGHLYCFDKGIYQNENKYNLMKEERFVDSIAAELFYILVPDGVFDWTYGVNDKFDKKHIKRMQEG